MKQFMGRYAELVNVLPVQIKIIALVMVFGIIFNLWRFVLWSPLQQKKMEVVSEISMVEKELTLLRLTIVGLQKRASLHIGQVDQAAVKSLKASPQKVSQVLKSLLVAKYSLKLISLKSTTGISAVPTVAGGVNKGTNIVDTVTPANSPKFLEHVIAIKFFGDYFSTLNYLKAIEQLNWPIYWDSLNYNVISYPDAEVSLQIRVLADAEE